MNAPRPADTRARILRELYGAEADALIRRVEDRLTETGSRRPAPRWDETTAWAIVYPDQFQTPGERPLATLRRAVQEHLRPEITGVHVLPWHPSSSDGGFSVTSFDEIDPAYGSWADVEALADTTALMGDAVLNHASAQGDWFQRFLAGDAEYAGFFRTVEPDADLSALVRPRAAPVVTHLERPNGASVSVWATFSPDQIDLDYRNPEVLLRMLDVLLRYVEVGVRAIRLDAVAFVWKVEGTTSIHLPETHLVIRFLRACLDSVDPGVLLVTETNVPHEENVSYFGPPGVREAQAVYQFPLPPLVLHSFVSGSAVTLRTWAGGLDLDRDDTTFMNFLASHDGIGLRPAEGLLDSADIAALERTCVAAGGIVNHRALADGSQAPYELTGTWFAHLAAGHDAAAALDRHVASHAIALALRGVPLLYVHSLFASGNDIEAAARSGSGRDLNRARFRMAHLGAALRDKGSLQARTWSRLAAMLRLRASSAAFAPSAHQEILDAPDALFVVRRRASDGVEGLVAVNVSPEPAVVSLPEGEWIAADTPSTLAGDVHTVPGWSSRWWHSS